MNSLEQDDGSELRDAEYVVSSRNGCPDHFRLLVQRYQRPLFAYLSSRLGNHLEAEEAAQESFVRAFLSLKKLRKPESFYAWLLGIAGRVLKEQFRAVERRQKDRAVAETLLTPRLGAGGAAASIAAGALAAIGLLGVLTLAEVSGRWRLSGPANDTSGPSSSKLARPPAAEAPRD